jgi:hypothetical protein
VLSHGLFYILASRKLYNYSRKKTRTLELDRNIYNYANGMQKQTKITFTRLSKSLLRPKFLVAALVLSLVRKTVPYFVNYIHT